MNETYQSPRRPCPPHPPGTDPCKAPDNQTQKVIVSERLKLCDQLYVAAGNISKQELKYDGEMRIYEEKKCLFKWTEENYQRHRNYDVLVGTELIQTNESVKTSVESYNSWNKSLSDTLKNIAKQVKDAKGKFSEFQDFASKLEKCLKDKCNTTQVIALTGKSPDNPDFDQKDQIAGCEEAKVILDELTNIPGGLFTDMDSLFQASHDVVGIQIFSNIDSLVSLQKTLEQQSKDFSKHITEVVKAREGDLKSQQDELVKTMKELTKAGMDRNYARSDLEGYLDAVDFLCCPVCDCVVVPAGENNSMHKNRKEYPPRLIVCEKCICEICEEVKKAFCCTPPDTQQQRPHSPEANAKY